jgi:hypothetical protein
VSRPDSLSDDLIPPAVIGFLLLLAATLAVVFVIAAQTVHTP